MDVRRAANRLCALLHHSQTIVGRRRRGGEVETAPVVADGDGCAVALRRKAKLHDLNPGMFARVGQRLLDDVERLRGDLRRKRCDAIHRRVDRQRHAQGAGCGMVGQIVLQRRKEVRSDIRTHAAHAEPLGAQVGVGRGRSVFQHAQRNISRGAQSLVEQGAHRLCLYMDVRNQLPQAVV